MAIGNVHKNMSWRIEVDGTEIIENKEIVSVSGRDVKLYGAAGMNYALTANITLKQVKGKWAYDHGAIAKAAVSKPTLKYIPNNVYKIKRYFLSNDKTIASFQGRRLGGTLINPNVVKLTWPMPTGFKQPAVEVVSQWGGQEKQAAFVSLHFMDQLAVYHLQLQDGWKKNFEKLFTGTTERAKVKYQIEVKKM